VLHAYCDASYAVSPLKTPFYVVAGFIGEQEQWALFNSLWRQSMRDLHIETIGCHASKCANGAGPFRHIGAERRAEIQNRLIVDIAASRLFGAVSVIDMAAYQVAREVINDTMSKSDRQYNEPHVHAVRQCVQHMCLVTEDVTDEPIAFVIDRNQEFGKRAKAWYDISVNNPQDRHHFRLGPFSEADRMQAIGLQAADLLAYAGFRHANGNPGWQWAQMKAAIKISEFVTAQKFWDEITVRFRQARENLASP